MDDLIRRQDAIDAFFNATSDGDKAEFCVAVVKNIPSAQQWIPCSERLPYSQEDVLCDEDGHVILGFYTDEEIGWHDTHSYRIYPTAWMPLPEPFKNKYED